MNIVNEENEKKIRVLVTRKQQFRCCSKPNRSKRKPQIEPIQAKTTKNRIWFECIQIFFLLNRMVWFDLRFWFYQPNQTKPQYNKNIN